MPVRTPAELADIDGLALPGGESTTMSRLLRVFGLEDTLRAHLAQGMPTFSTCAGTILLSREIRDGVPDQLALGALDLCTRRNGYGRQLESFEHDLLVPALGTPPFTAVFIRAPVIEAHGAAVEVLASYEKYPVVVRQGGHLAFTFHPEMTDDLRFHALFAEQVRDREDSAA